MLMLTARLILARGALLLRTVLWVSPLSSHERMQFNVV